MRALFILILLIVGHAGCCGQWTEKYRIETSSDYIAFDNLLNLYVVDGSEIAKYNSDGDFQFRFSDKQLGEITTVDVTYPLRPLLLYSDLNYLILLDNTLSNNRDKINLFNLNIGLATQACSSVQNHFWFYDAMNFALIRVNEKFKEVSKSGNLAQVLQIELQPTNMREFSNKLYMNNPETGILVFDIYGTYIKTIPIKGLDNFQVFENKIVYLEDNHLVMYHTLRYEEKREKLPVEALSAHLQKNRLAIRQKDGVVILEKPQR
jgi:hypothetical protein